MRSISKRVGIWGLAAALVVLVGVVASVFAAHSLARHATERDHQAFMTESEQVTSALKLAIQREEDLVGSGAARIVDLPRESNSRFQVWIRQMQVMDRYPEVLTISRITYVRRAEFPAFAARARRDPVGPLGPGGSYEVIPPGNRPFYCLISQVAYRPGIAPAPAGQDICEPSVKGESEAILASRDSAQGAYMPITWRNARLLAIQQPVYEGGVTPTTLAGRRRALTDFSAMLISPKQIIDKALVGHPGTEVRMRYRNDISSVVFSSGTAPEDRQSVAVPLTKGWTVRVSGAAAATGLLATRDSTVVLLAGITVSALLGLLMFVLGTGRSRALRLVEEKTGELNHVALHDALTGLPNRALVMDRAERMLARAARNPIGIAALFIDIDGFKQVNDSFGHAAGDQVLKTVGERLQEVVRGQDTVGRLGGDEFVVLLEATTAEAPPEMVAERLIEVLRRPIELDAGGKTVSVSASIGIAVDHQGSADDLLRDADLALYAAKDAGKDRYILFEARMQIDAEDRSKLKLDLRVAVEQEQFFLQYQPTFDLQTRSVAGVEALIRWQHPTRGVVLPDTFIGLAEETGLIIPIGRWVLDRACEQAASWHRAGHHIGMSVNVSAVQLEKDGLQDDVREVLTRSGLDPRFLTLEITETALMRDVTAATARLGALKALGIRIAIDDFGTGYSSLAYLRQFPIDSLKIDRSFIAGIADSTQSTALIHTLVQLGKTLNIETLAEGIEDQRQLDRLEHEQVDHGQGFLFARPLDADAIEHFLNESPSQPAGVTSSDR